VRRAPREPLTLIRTGVHPNVAFDVLEEFESVILEQGRWRCVSGPRSRIAAKVQALIQLVRPSVLRRRRPFSRYIALGFGLGDWNGALRGGLSIHKALPYIGYSAELKALWMCDAWIPSLPKLEAAVRRFGVQVVMLSSREASEQFRARRVPGVSVFWVPEAIDSRRFETVPHTDRSIDVLQVGRQWRWYHEQIVGYCRAHGIRYVHPRACEASAPPLFPSRAAFVAGLSRSRICICVPRSVTDPEQTGEVTTMTSRYLQAMSSRCLVLGLCPDEMKDLFGYVPVIEIDRQDPGGQLRALMARFEDYLPLIERNYETVLRHHQWTHRVRLIEQCIAAHTSPTRDHVVVVADHRLTVPVERETLGDQSQGPVP
jgi:hypothetical protein